MKEANKKNNKWTQITLFLKENKNEDEGKNKHAVTLSIYTQTTVKTVKLSVQKSTCY